MDNGSCGFSIKLLLLVLGSHFKWLLRTGDTTELDRDQAETNPSNQSNQPSVLGRDEDRIARHDHRRRGSGPNPRVAPRDADGMTS